MAPRAYNPVAVFLDVLNNKLQGHAGNTPDDEDADTWTDDDQQRYEYEMGKEANRRGDYWDEADLNEAEEVKDD